MDINSIAYSNRKKHLIDLPTLGLCLIVGLSFLLHLFTRIFSGYAYAVLLAFFTVIFIFSRRVVLKAGNRLAQIWLLAVVTLVISFLHSQRSNGALLDVIVFTCGFLLLLFHSNNENVYARCIKLIKLLGIFFAIGVLIQRFLPTLYRLVITVFPAAYRASLTSGDRSGFTLNAGYSAGYIIAGLLAVLAERPLSGSKRLRDYILPGIFLIALFLTGKRGPVMFMILTVVYCYLAPVKGSRKVTRYWRIFLVVLFAVIILWAFRDALSSIPIIGRTLNSIAGIIDGEDITTGRTRLYVWALELFRRNPIFGIGWGRYRTTVVGNVTLVKDLETHNIYLQLLAETGLIGFIVFVTTFIIFWNATRIAYCDCFQNKRASTAIWQKLLFFSLAYQTYFLLYGLTGNPLFDSHFQIMYIFSCLIIIAFKSVRENIFENY